MNILIIRKEIGGSYRISGLLKKMLKGSTTCYLDDYFPYRTDPSEDYPELDSTKGLIDRHILVVTRRFKNRRIKSKYLQKMDLVLETSKIFSHRD